MFFGTLDDRAVAIADPHAELYRAFDVDRGGMRQMFGLGSWKAGIRATLKGNMINRRIGDAWTMPTVFAVRNGSIVGEFRGRHAGDHPDVDALFTDVVEEST